MPTYDYKCPECGKTASVFQTISEYCREPKRPHCGVSWHEPMERRLSVVPAMSGIANAMAGDRHYAGLRAPDGTDISSRTKHREYMKSKGLTTADDFTGVWKKAEGERELFRKAEHSDKELHREIEKQVLTAVAQLN